MRRRGRRRADRGDGLNQTYFPIKSALSASRLPAPRASTTLAGAAAVSRRILLVEDNRVNQRVARYLLEKMGHSVVLAENGRVAVAAYTHETFDLILMDIQMPQMNGFEATAAIRQDEQARGGSRVPIIALTADAMTGDREKCLEAGMDAYVSKPLNTNLLAQTLTDLLPNAAVADRESSGRPSELALRD